MNNNKKINKFSATFIKLFGDEKKQFITIPIFSILLSVIVGGIIIALLGKNPFNAYLAFLQGAGFVAKSKYAGGANQFTDFMQFLNGLAPMLFAALAVVVAFKGGLFNIGVAGQMLLSGFMATIIVGYSDINFIVAKILVILIGIIVGGLLGAIVGYLKAKFNINEVVSTIMFNSIVMYLTGYIINDRLVNPVSRQSETINASAALTIKNVNMMGLKFNVSIGIVLAIIAAILVNFMLKKTKLGFEIKMVGSNRVSAKYAGINVNKTIIITMALSGMLAGMAGVTYYLGYYYSMQPKVLGSLGYDAIATALLGGASPIGVIFSSMIITVINEGSNYMNSKINIVKEIGGVIISLILIFSASSAYIAYKINKFRMENNFSDKGKVMENE